MYCSWVINDELGITSYDISHVPRGPNPDRQEPGGSTSDYLTLVLKKICTKSNCQEPGGRGKTDKKLTSTCKRPLTGQFDPKLIVAYRFFSRLLC